MGQIITIASGKGGAGKTTVANGLARVLCGMGFKVLLVDTDYGLCSAEFLLSGGNRVVYHLGDVISQGVSLEKALVTTPGEPDFLAASQGEDVLPEQAAAVIEQAANGYDYVLVDRAAGLDCTLESHLSSYICLVISQPDGMGIRGAANICTRLRQVGCPKCYLVLNRFRPNMVKAKNAPDIDTICDTVGAQLLGIVPESDQLFAHQAKGTFVLKSPYGKALFRIGSRLKGEAIPLPKLSKIMK